MSGILIIEDDEELYALLKEYLGEEGFLCRHALDGPVGLAALQGGGVDLVILDVMLPCMNGFEVLRHIRSTRATADIPILMLTARGEEVDRVVGLEMGADDYLPKPFSPRELVARLRALLRRAGSGPEQKNGSFQRVEDMLVNHGMLSVIIGEQTVELTAQEARLLEQLAQHIGQVVGRDDLYKRILGHPAYPLDRSLDMLVSRLRKKLGPRADGSPRVKAVRGEGYILLGDRA